MVGFQRMCLAFVLTCVGLGVGAAPTHAAETVTVSGVVLGTDGQPAAGATIELIEDADVDGCPEHHTDDHPVVLATTGADGRFSFTCTAGFIWVVARLATGESAASETFGSGVHDDVVFRVYATRGSITGTVYDEHGVPVPQAGMLFIWDQPGAGAYDYFHADAAGRYRVEGLYPGVSYMVTAYDHDDPPFYFTATEGELVHDFGAPQPTDQPPDGAITRSDGDGRLEVSGWAHDDVGVAKVLVAIRNRATGKWLRLDGTWGDYQRHATRMTAPGAHRTGWWLVKRLPAGSYGVSLVVKDSAGNRNPSPRPWRAVRVRR